VAEAYAGTRFRTVFEGREAPNDARVPELLRWCRRLAAMGLTESGAGNVSLRASPGFLISRTAGDLAAIGPGELVHVLRTDPERHEVAAAGAFEPSSESFLHAAAYEGRPDVGAVFHVHSDRILEAAEELGLPVTAREHPYGTTQLAAEASQVLGSDLFVLRRHGIVALGATPAQAGARLEELVSQLAG
jgi:ribulose-5-phosphate 4-epimerase/fuculose-1-phosphate aldolase